MLIIEKKKYIILLMKDYYKILNLNKTATLAEIKKQYKTLAMIHHPDKGGDSEKFKDIAEAYEVLSDSNKRNQFDNPYHTFNFNQQFVNPNDIFKNFFGHNDFNFNNFSFSSRSSNISQKVNVYSKSTTVYTNGNIRIEKTTEIKNGVKTESTKETDLLTGIVKNNVKHIQ